MEQKHIPWHFKTLLIGQTGAKNMYIETVFFTLIFKYLTFLFLLIDNSIIDYFMLEPDIIGEFWLITDISVLVYMLAGK